MGLAPSALCRDLLPYTFHLVPSTLELATPETSDKQPAACHFGFVHYHKIMSIHPIVDNKTDLSSLCTGGDYNGRRKIQDGCGCMFICG
jgi:hypothetical protein